MYMCKGYVAFYDQAIQVAKMKVNRIVTEQRLGLIFVVVLRTIIYSNVPKQCKQCTILHKKRVNRRFIDVQFH